VLDKRGIHVRTLYPTEADILDVAGHIRKIVS